MDVPRTDDRVQLRRRTGRGEGTSVELLVDGRLVRHGRFADGAYFLYDNAYVWSPDLLQLGRQLVSDRAQRRVPRPRRMRTGE